MGPIIFSIVCRVCCQTVRIPGQMPAKSGDAIACDLSQVLREEKRKPHYRIMRTMTMTSTATTIIILMMTMIVLMHQLPPHTQSLT